MKTRRSSVLHCTYGEDYTSKLIKISTEQKKPIIISQYFIKLFKYAVEKNFISRQQAKKASNKQLKRETSSIGWKTSKRFCAFMISFLSIPLITLQNWASIFYTRLLIEKKNLYNYHIKGIKKLINCFINDHPLEAYNSFIPTSIQLLLKYINTHLLDPDNSLIGLTVHEKYQKLYYHTLDNIQMYNINESINKHDIILKILQWNKLNDLEMIKNDINQFSKDLFIETNKQLQKGDLIILCMDIKDIPMRYSCLTNEIQALGLKNLDNNPYVSELFDLIKRGNVYKPNDIKSQQTVVIGRFISHVDNKKCLISVDPIELETIEISYNKIVAFTNEMKDLIKPHSMKTLITDESQSICYVLTEATESLIQDYLRNIPCNYDIIEKIKNKTTSITDLVEIQDIIEILDKNIENSQDIISNVSQKLTPLREKMALSVSKLFIFQPQRSIFENYLTDGYYCTLIVDILHQYYNLAIQTEEKLNTKILQLLNGSKKLKITEYWISLLQSTLHNYLEKEGYDFYPISNTFICPSQQIIRRNIFVIDVLLSEDHFPLLYTHIITPLINTIYPKLDKYKRNIIKTLLTYIPCCTEDNFNNNVFIKELEINIKNQSISNDNGPQFIQLLQDIEYINTMKLLEEQFYNNYSLYLKSFDVMPITGLVLTYISKMKRELQSLLNPSSLPSTKQWVRRAPQYKIQIGDWLLANNLSGDIFFTRSNRCSSLYLSKLESEQVQILQKQLPIQLFDSNGKDRALNYFINRKDSIKKGSEIIKFIPYCSSEQLLPINQSIEFTMTFESDILDNEEEQIENNNNEDKDSTYIIVLT